MHTPDHAPENRARMQCHRATGFTMVELMVAIVIACILAAVAAPGFTNLIASQRAKSIASELYAALSKARSEAITRNANVTLSPQAGGWQNGWQILDPANASNVLEDRSVARGATVSGPAGVTYQGAGRILAGSAPSFVITPTGGATGVYQCISIDLSGRPYMKAASSC